MDFIFGIRAVMEAIHSGKELSKVLIKKGLRGDLIKELSDLLRQHNHPVQYVPVEKLNRITRKAHQGVVAFISPIEYVNVEKLLPKLYEKGKDPFMLILDGITDVRNFGAIVRTAECSGVDAIIVPTRGGALVGADAIKTSAGALMKVPICRVWDLKQAIRFLKESGVKVVVATEKAEKIYTKIDYSLPVAMVLGSEEKGVSTPLFKECDELARIPLLGEIASLNVSASASVLCYEVARQRRWKN